MAHSSAVKYARQLPGGNWSDNGASSSAQGTSSGECLELRVSVSSEAEVPYVHAAIRYAYTGRVVAASVREALEVLRKGEYLGIKGCAAACLKVVDAMLAPDGADPNEQQQDIEPADAALELYACHTLWPSPQEGLDFSATLDTAKQLLVGHFGDTLAVLNTRPLMLKLLDLPAPGVQALLESDGFGTDREDSVLLLLATWVCANRNKVDAASIERLCRLVRLVQLSPTYLATILPALALDHEAGSGWFPITRLQLSLVQQFAGLSLAEITLLRQDGHRLMQIGPWYSTKQRRQCVPQEGLSFYWHISQQQLGQALQNGERTRAVFSAGQTAALVAGLEWFLLFDNQWVRLVCRLPCVYFTPGPSCISKKNLLSLVRLNADLVVDEWEGDVREDGPQILVRPTRPFLASIGTYVRLPPPPPQQQQQQQAHAHGAGGNGASPLAAFAPYLHEGRITGRLTLLR